MLDALVSGKLSHEQENMEDVLTSAVFGSLKYVAPHEGLLRWLGEANTLEGARPASAIPDPVYVEYQFWPRWYESGCVACEPDLALTIRVADGSIWLVCIEAKYRSGKSSLAVDDAEAPNDQLAREWDNLVCVSKRLSAKPVLVYVTADYTLPRHEIEDSIADFRRTRPTHGNPVLAWLPWRSIPRLFNNHSSPMLADLARLARRLDLTFFEGVNMHDEVYAQTWTFDFAAKAVYGGDSFAWALDENMCHIAWRFSE
jgi:hypothetical protein